MCLFLLYLYYLALLVFPYFAQDIFMVLARLKLLLIFGEKH